MSRVGAHELVVGGVRVADDGHFASETISEQSFAESIQVGRLGQGWAIVAGRSGRAYEAHTFLGEAEARGAAPAALHACEGERGTDGRRHYVGEDGRLYVLTPGHDIMPDESLDDAFVTACRVVTNGSRVLTTGRGTLTRAQGMDWQAASAELGNVPTLEPDFPHDWDASAAEQLRVRLEARLHRLPSALAGCERVTPWFVTCPGVARRLTRSGRWILAPTPAANYVVADDLSSVLLSRGCEGERRHACLLRRDGVAETVDVDITNSASLAFNGRVVFDFSMGDYVALENGAHFPMPPALCRWTARDARATVDHVMATTLPSAQNPPRLLRIALPELSVREVLLPPGTTGLCMLDSERGVLHDASGRVSTTEDGGAHWEATDFRVEPEGWSCEVGQAHAGTLSARVTGGGDDRSVRVVAPAEQAVPRRIMCQAGSRLHDELQGGRTPWPADLITGRLPPPASPFARVIAGGRTSTGGVGVQLDTTLRFVRAGRPAVTFPMARLRVCADHNARPRSRWLLLHGAANRIPLAYPSGVSGGRSGRFEALLFDMDRRGQVCLRGARVLSLLQPTGGVLSAPNSDTECLLAAPDAPLRR